MISNRLGGWVWTACVLAAGMTACREPQIEPARGELVAAAPLLGFGATTLGIEVERELVLEQRGRLPARVVAWRLEPEAAAFKMISYPTLLARESTGRLVLGFRPTREGPQRTRLVLDLLEGTTTSVDLEGVGVDARAEGPAAIDFGRPALGAVRRRSLRLKNNFETPLPATLRIAGRDAAEFVVTRSFWMEPHSEVAASLVWSPVVGAGVREAVVELLACPLCSAEVIPIHAEAVATPFLVTPDPVQAGGVQIDRAREVTVTITNLTDETFGLRSVVLAPGTDPGFRLVAPISTLLVPGVPLTGQITFTPMRLGAAEGVLAIDAASDPPSTREVKLLASGGGPQLVVVPTVVDLRSVHVGARAVRTITITNGGADTAAPPLVVTGLAIEGPGFSLNSLITGNGRLYAGESMEVEVAFTPTLVGPASGKIRVSADDPVTPFVDVELVAIAEPPVNCQLRVDPPNLEFGVVREAKSATLAVRVTNEGTDDCSLWDGRIVGDGVFTLAKPRPMIALEPGEAFVAPIEFMPLASGRTSALLRFDTNRTVAPLLDVALGGGLETTCLRPEPGTVGFGLRRVDCGPADLPAVIHNVCLHPVELYGIELGLGTDAQTLTLVAPPTLPVRLEPDGRVEMTVHYEPGLVGYQTRPLFADSEDTTDPLLMALTAETLEAANHEEFFIEPSPSKLDLLWVVDNTSSMRGERAVLSRDVRAFLREADRRGIDYRIGVTTTGVGVPTGTIAEPCAGGAEGGESGRLFPVDHSRPRIVDPSQADRVAILSANVDVGGCHAVEQGVEATRLALTAPLITHDDIVSTPPPNDGNRGFLRPDAALAVVVVSDEDDESPGTLEERLELLRGIKPISPFSFHAIVAPAGGCASAVEPGLDYLAAVAAFGGTTASSCEADWTTLLSSLAGAVLPPRLGVVLEAEADPASIEVTLDGVPTTAFRYVAARQTLVFDPLPPPGTLIRVHYREPCPIP